MSAERFAPWPLGVAVSSSTINEPLQHAVTNERSTVARGRHTGASSKTAPFRALCGVPVSRSWSGAMFDPESPRACDRCAELAR